jgi:hypothetical protein
LITETDGLNSSLVGSIFYSGNFPWDETSNNSRCIISIIVFAIALITADKFKRLEKNRNNVHKPVVATFSVFEVDGKKYFQIDTYGSSERLIPDKVSQSIQFDKAMAKTIIDIIQRELLLVSSQGKLPE